ncbi:hypothetical protein [Ruegeria sp. HKCCD8929]|uniref:hypothetical protein n=1 Tax=Ruegeria sp. HKCCD8929 TaxID=2683006 RepID=UPI0014892B0F|nr:hypothetical protein [Ruegeria sp. HKCCD8929]
MSHIANHRIKKDGKYYAAGDPIELTDDDLAELPDGAVRDADPDDEAANDNAGLSEEEKFEALRAAVKELPDTVFKKDGEIRADALKALNEQLGMQLTAENVAVAKAATE